MSGPEQALITATSLDVEDHEEELLVEEVEGAALPFVLQKLRPRHKQALALVAQGYQHVVVSKMVGYTPHYVRMLLRQPVCIEFIRTINEAVAQDLELQFGSVVEVIKNGMRTGNVTEQLKAARLQLEVTKRVGSARAEVTSSVSSEERLAALAHRLIDLNAQLVGGPKHEVIQQRDTEVPGQAVLRGELVRGQGEGRRFLPGEDAAGEGN